MTKKRSTKRALLMSALLLMMCMSMLIGSTFAWFTDSVTSSGNIIKSGTLKVTMEWAEGTEAVPADESDEWVDASTGAIFNCELWEPGYTEVRHIKIANEGTLALKYQLNIIASGNVSELSDVIDVYYADPAVQVTERTELDEDNKLGTLTELLADFSTSASGSLAAGEKDTITLALKMQETAGNAYQDLAIGSDFIIQLLATQYTEEFDSFDNQYDANAPKMFAVNGVNYETVAEALTAAEDGDEVYLSGATEPIVIDNAITLTIENTNIIAGEAINAITVNANATIVAEGYSNLTGGKNADGIHVAENATLTLTGDGILATKGNAGLEYYRTTGSDKLVYGETLSNTSDAAYEGTGGSGIDVAGDIVITKLANLIAEGYGIHGFGIGGSSDSIKIEDTTINYVRGGFVCADMFIPDWAGHFYGKKEPTGGAAIGSSTDGATITITNSEIMKAEGGSKAAGIGALYHTGVTVNIADSTITTIGGNASAGIGGSRVASGATDEDAINVNITNSTIKATGGYYAAGIGSGYNTYADEMATTPTTTVSIDAASNIVARGGKLGAGIGTGHNVLNFVGNIACDVTNVKAGDNHDDCCHGAICSDVEDIGLGAYKVEARYTKLSDGLFTDTNANFYVYNAEGLEGLHAWYTDETDTSYNMRKAFWGKTYNIMADIDATGYTWKTVKTNMDSATYNGITFNGNGHTISNLTIEGNGLFTGATQGANDGTDITVIKDLTLDNVTVTGASYHNGAVWGEVIGSVTLENVNVINSKVSGGCNVGGLVGRNSESHATIKFINCSVKNTTVEATKLADYAGASAFLGNALHIGTSCSANVVFEGDNVSEGNTLITAAGMQGGGIYTTAEWGALTWENPTVVTTFTNYNSAD